MELLARYLGVQFTAGEIRRWGGQHQQQAKSGYRDQDPVLLPLALALRPELQQALVKMIGADGVPLPQEYVKRAGEVVVDLGKVTVKEFQDFFKSKQAPAAPAP